MKGEVLSILLNEGSIKIPEIVTFIRKLLRGKEHIPTTIFWDNLRSHYSAPIIAEIERYDANIEYNAPYSSEYNCIERLWSYSKRIFRKRCLLEGDYRNQN